MWYSIAGSLNSIFIVVSLLGIWSQIKLVNDRKKNYLQAAHGTRSDRPTDVLSLNQFTVSFLAYWSFFVYGYSIRPFNHFIVWPRMIAALLILRLLWEMYADRKTLASRLVFIMAGVLMNLGVLGLVLGNTFVDEGRLVSQALIVIITLFLAQGYVHQISLIVASGKTGAVSLKMSQFILAMDVTTILFAFVMGLQAGWPLLFLATVSAITKLAIMWLFVWVRRSPVAAQRRNAMAELVA
ncbi:hypothetical protein [Undibacterium sp. TS12]|uniref:hypothetical protein n=1 Tax=Undibacterium sp. TS12 TaxID=2908202 RepID=UPI001F4D1DE9|nr:hypothetical protein [Undibacterium sp. TS12]MCH8619926.1 hypothetical protein [Undibacterium sp. TS12]